VALSGAEIVFIIASNPDLSQAGIQENPMEQTRLFVAIALSFIIFLAWDYFFVSKDAPPPQEPAAVQSETIPEKGSVAESRPSSSEAADTPETPNPATPETPALSISPETPTRSIEVRTNRFTATLNEGLATVSSMKLRQYKETIDSDSDWKEVVNPSITDGIFSIGLKNNSIAGLASATFRSPENDLVDAVSSDRTVSFAWQSANGITVTKQFHFQPDSYLVALTVTISNKSNQRIEDALFISAQDVANNHDKRYGFTGPVALIGNDLQQIETDDLDERNMWSGDIKWSALTQNYFMTAIIPKEGSNGGFGVTMNDDRYEGRVFSAESDIPANSSKIFQYQLFAGPKSSSLLESIGYELERVIDFGWFDIIAKPCLWLMNFFYGMIPNYGIAIILLTILTKIVLWPLGTKSYKSMNEMKKIQPLMAELREKYKDDKKKMNEELMKLYRVYKINPMGGCLPMLVQIPVFIALYRMLYEAIELRHAAFLWWINDLSAPDRLGNFDFAIPFMQAPYGVPVLTVVMGATMFLQQKMSPPPGDPTQAKMMMFLPIVFTVIFINFPAGLVLYWLVNNTMSIAQQYFIQKKNS
jgi:YidC/Oxa1 family membrane protein insertase